jgi:hypothetical protein
VKTATNKWILISKSRDDLNRYTPCMGNLIHMTHTLLAPVHVRHTYAFRGQSPYVATFNTDPTELDRFTAPEKKCSRIHLSARLSDPRDPPQFIVQHNHLSSALKPNIYWQTCYINLLGPYHQHVIIMFNTYSQWPTHRSLTDTCSATTLEVPACHITHSDLSTQRFPLST